MGKEQADHLVKKFEEFYVVEKDWEGKKYCRITLDFDYIKRQVHLSMPGYCDEGLQRFRHECQKMDRPATQARPTHLWG